MTEMGMPEAAASNGGAAWESNKALRHPGKLSRRTGTGQFGWKAETFQCPTWDMKSHLAVC